MILCSGKIYHDLVAHASYGSLQRTAIARIELLAPLPVGEINRVISGYPKLKKILWVQEEPKNMGARAFVRRRLLEGKRDGFDIEYIGRGYRASPERRIRGPARRRARTHSGRRAFRVSLGQVLLREHSLEQFLDGCGIHEEPSRMGTDEAFANHRVEQLQECVVVAAVI